MSKTPMFQIDRKKGIGASEAAALFNLSKYLTQLKLQKIKLGELGENEEKRTTEAHIGHLLEPLLLNYVCDMLGFDHAVFNSQVFKQNSYSFAHIDYLKNDNSIIIECKTTTTRFDDEWGVEMTDDIPAPVQIQVQVQMALSGATVSYIPVLFFRDGVRSGLESAIEFMDIGQLMIAISKLIETDQCRFSVYKCDANQSLGRELIIRINAWYNKHIIQREPVVPVTKEDCRLLYDELNIDEPVTATEEQVALVSEFNQITQTKKELNGQLRELEAEQDKLQVELEKIMGANNKLICPDGELVRKIIKRKAYQAKESQYVTFKFNQPRKKA